jgi:tetratricopeptide (TPR) repeat protein
MHRIATGIALALAAAAPALAADDEPGRQVSTAAQLMLDGKIAPALAAVEAPLATYARRHAAEKRRLYCAMTPAQTVMAMAAGKTDAVAIDPDYCTALFIKGYALADMKRFEEAEATLGRAIGMAPFHAHYLSELGYVYQQQERWQLSYDTYARAAANADFADERSRVTERTRAWRGMGYDLVEMNRWDEAEAMYRKCLEVDPDDAKSKAELKWIAEQRAKRT